MLFFFFFFFSSRRRHTRLQGDWSSDVCSSDLGDDTDLFPGGRVRLIRLDEARQRVPDLVGPYCQLRHRPRVSLVIFFIWLSLCLVHAEPWRHAARRRRSTARRLAMLPSMNSSPIRTDMPPTKCGSMITLRWI